MGSTLRTQGSRCRGASIPSPRDLIYANAEAIRPGTIDCLNPPQQGEGRDPILPLSPFKSQAPGTHSMETCSHNQGFFFLQCTAPGEVRAQRPF
jgi:hypothetical protein